MEILDCPQGSLDWIINRLYRLTASEASGIITPNFALKNSKASEGEIDKLVAGLYCAGHMRENPEKINAMDDRELQNFIAHYTGNKFFGNIHTLRGNDMEPETIALMSDRVGAQFQDVGMVVMGDATGVVSCSPDGGIFEGGKMVAGGEVKGPILAKHLRYMKENVLPPEYKLQVHFSMAVCGLDTWHFGTLFSGHPLFYHEVKRDNDTDRLSESLEKFDIKYQDVFNDLSEAKARCDAEMKNKDTEELI